MRQYVKCTASFSHRVKEQHSRVLYLPKRLNLSLPYNIWNVNTCNWLQQPLHCASYGDQNFAPPRHHVRVCMRTSLLQATLQPHSTLTSASGTFDQVPLLLSGGCQQACDPLTGLFTLHCAIVWCLLLTLHRVILHNLQKQGCAERVA